MYILQFIIIFVVLKLQNMETLIELSKNKIRNTDMDFIRYAMNDLDWNQRLTGITGARGVGKTTLMLQYIRKHYTNSEHAVYISLDELFFSSNTLVGFADRFVKNGGKHLFIDEVHKYPGWSTEIKNIYDRYNKLKVVFSGSSALEIFRGKADLSRRALHYHMHGLSLREYIELAYGIRTPVLHLADILSGHDKACNSIIAKVETPIKYFNEYIKHGVYPFYNEDRSAYHKRLSSVISHIIETDMPALYGIDYSSVMSIKKLLYIISSIVPFKPNISELSRKMNVSRESVMRYLHFLDRADITTSLLSNTGGISLMNKPEKIYLNNPNLFHTLAEENRPNTGTLRESFFMHQMSQAHKVAYSLQGDFMVDGKFTFEIGGPSKKTRQIRNLKNAYIASDDIEYGYKNTIPLWLFGFLY